MLSFFRASLSLVPTVLILVLAPFTKVHAEDSLQQISQYAQLNSAPVTSVTQLSDVQPTDWAFQALQSLVERYGCIAGYSDGEFKGNHAITRFEFATALNACLDTVNQRIDADIRQMVNKEDLATLQKLQEEYAAELATLKGRVNALEAHIEQLEKEKPKCSKTPKLDGQVIIAVTDAFGDANRSGNGDNSNLTVSDRLRLNVKTCFFEKDELLVRFQVSSVINPIAPGNEARLSFQSGSSSNNEAFVSKLQYRFPVSEQVTVLLATGSNTYFDDWDVINPLKSDADGAISRYGRYSPIFRLGGDTGIGVTYKPSRNIKVEMAYLAKNTNNPASGLFNGGYGALGQIIYYPNGMPKDPKKENIVTKFAFTYVKAYNNDGLAHNTGSLASNLGGREVSSNSYGIETNVVVSNGFQLGGWLAYTNARALSGEVKGDADIWSWAVTLAFPDLGKKGNLGGIIVGMQPKLTGSSAELSGLPRRDPDTGFHIEGFYRYQINDNISITPGLIWLTAPNHNEQNGDIFVGVVRTTFKI